MKTQRVITLFLILSGSFISSCQDDEVTPVVPPPAIVEWAGVFDTETAFWGSYYSPLVVTAEGTVFIAEQEIQFDFDEALNSLSFDWHDIKAQRAKGSIIFSKKADGRLQFSGSINPRAQDGPVTYTGDAN